MADGGFQFSLLRSLHLITLVFTNIVFSMNLFLLVYIESIHRGSPAVRDPRGDKSLRDLTAVVRPSKKESI
jgi:hypothetical protein